MGIDPRQFWLARAHYLGLKPSWTAGRGATRVVGWPWVPGGKVLRLELVCEISGFPKPGVAAVARVGVVAGVGFVTVVGGGALP